jgi:uncharacterized OB-fold protein
MAMDLPPPGPAKYVERELDAAGHEYYRRLSRGQLATTCCPGCGQITFPPRRTCMPCARDQVWVELPRRGILHAFTTQEAAVRFSAPVVLALAELGEAVLPGICESGYETLSIGQPILVEIRTEPETGLAILAFVPESPRPFSRS